MERRSMLGLLSAALTYSLSASEARAQAEGGGGMERVQGIGGFFFRADDPKALAQWYLDHLGINPVPTGGGAEPWKQEAGTTAFAPFPRTSSYWKSPTQQWMINFRVRDLDKMVAQLRDAHIPVEVAPSDYGKFAHLADPEGNPIELWEPQ
jgi:glyoxylase I family protein